VHDWPLLRYLGANAATPRFRPTLYPRERTELELRLMAQDPTASRGYCGGVLLANKEFPHTRTATPVIASMFGILAPRSVELPDRSESVVLGLFIDCEPGCYTLIGGDIDDRGNIVDPKRIDWTPSAAFMMPPGFWYSHHNPTDSPARLLPIQDAGLYTYLRSLGRPLAS
jgi:hypothetical protein